MERAQTLGLSFELSPYSSTDGLQRHQPGLLPFIDIPLHTTCIPGHPDIQNASHVLAQLDMAVNLCQSGECAAMVTAPVHKAVINDAGVPFSGHTEYLADATGAEQSVMLLVSGDLRVALATTHLPLRAVPDALDPHRLKQLLRTLHNDLANRFGCTNPRITVLGLNPTLARAAIWALKIRNSSLPFAKCSAGKGWTFRDRCPPTARLFRA